MAIKIKYDKKKLDKICNITNNIQEIETFKNAKFQRYIIRKVRKVLNEVMEQRFNTQTTTNDYAISTYKRNNHIKLTDNGFILYNGAMIPVSAKDKSTYPQGKFPLALAFEYGVGIVGEGTYDGKYFTPWEYNVNNYNFGWYYTDENGVKQHTYGYEGYEIYRFVADRINKEIHEWVLSYIMRGAK